MIPSHQELEVPLLKALADKGGKAKPGEMYEALSRMLGLTDADLAETLPTGDNRFRNRVRWARQILIDKGDMIAPTTGFGA